MQAAAIAIGALLFLASLPVALELALFLLANLFLRSRLSGRPRASAAEATPLRIAVLVPAHDEAGCIARCVSSLLASERGVHELEVVVIADNCRDETASIARSAGARVVERFDESVRGKGAAIHYAVSLLMPESHDAFLIVDADTVVAPGFVRVMGDRFARGDEALQCVYLPLNVEASPKVRLMNLALLSMNYLKPAGREILGCSVGILGNGFGLRKELLRDIPYTANSITEDLEYHLKLIEGGRKVRFVSDTRVLADFPVSKEGSDTQRERWEGGRFMLQRRFFLPMLSKILSGKARMIEPFLELMSMPLSYEVLLLLALALVPGQPFRIYGIAGLFLILAQMLAAVFLYGTRRDLLAFLEIPGYLLWKIVKLPAILRTSRRNSSWIRTKRD